MNEEEITKEEVENVDNTNNIENYENVENEENVQNVKNTDIKEEVNKKDEFEKILEKIKKMSEAIELHDNVKKAVSDQEVDDNYLRYIENSIEEKLFNDVKFDKLKSKVLIEVICPELSNIDNFEKDKLEIVDVSSHFEEIDNYIDKVCLYDNKFICMFGVNDRNPEKVLKYEARKFIRADMIEAIMQKVGNNKISKLEQYDEYYIVTTEEGIKIFSERKSTALIKIEETFFDKLKSKLSALFTIQLFIKKKYLPKIDVVFDTNQNRFENFKQGSKVDAKKRMKTLLNCERKEVRSTNNI